MSERKELDLALRVLDQQVIDWSGRRCGNVDDIAIDGKPGESASVRGLLFGREATRRRRPRLFASLSGPTFGDKPDVEVPWSAIQEITQVVKLKEDAADLGLGAGDDRLANWVGRIPGAS